MNAEAKSFEQAIEYSHGKLKFSLLGCVALFLALAPVLDPYIIIEVGSAFTIRVNDLFVILLGVICFVKDYRFHTRTGILVLLVTGLLLISFFGVLGSTGNLTKILKIVFVWYFRTILLMYIWKTPCRSSYLRYIKIIGTFAAMIAILQFICGNIGISMWNGELPIPLSRYDGWSGYIDRNTGDIRPCGIFQEASYVGLYLLIPYAQALKENKLILAIPMATAMLLTTSMVAVGGTIITTAYIIINRKQSKINTRAFCKILAVLAFVSIVFGILIQTNEAVASAWDYVYDRLLSIESDLSSDRVGSTKLRLLGNIEIFKEYTLWQKIFGVGISQYSNVFTQVPYSYSNVYVTTILNSGIIGLIFFIGIIFFLFKHTERENYIFLVLFLVVIGVDYLWMNWYFFNYLSAALLTDHVVKRNYPIVGHERNENLI